MITCESEIKQSKQKILITRGVITCENILLCKKKKSPNIEIKLVNVSKKNILCAK